MVKQLFSASVTIMGIEYQKSQIAKTITTECLDINHQKYYNYKIFKN